MNKALWIGAVAIGLSVGIFGAIVWAQEAAPAAAPAAPAVAPAAAPQRRRSGSSRSGRGPSRTGRRAGAGTEQGSRARPRPRRAKEAWKSKRISGRSSAGRVRSVN